MTDAARVTDHLHERQEQKMSQKWEYKLAPLREASTLKRSSDSMSIDRLNELGSDGWEAVGLSLKKGDLVAWPVVLMKRPVG